jgi:hypothetical protein
LLILDLPEDEFFIGLDADLPRMTVTARMKQTAMNKKAKIATTSPPPVDLDLSAESPSARYPLKCRYLFFTCCWLLVLNRKANLLVSARAVTHEGLAQVSLDVLFEAEKSVTAKLVRYNQPNQKQIWTLRTSVPAYLYEMMLGPLFSAFCQVDQKTAAGRVHCFTDSAALTKVLNEAALSRTFADGVVSRVLCTASKPVKFKYNRDSCSLTIGLSYLAENADGTVALSKAKASAPSS